MNWLKLISENITNEISADDAYKRFYNSIPRGDYDKILQGNPAPDRFLQFVLNLVRDKHERVENASKVVEKYNEIKPEIRQILQNKVKAGEYDSLQDILDDMAYFENGGVYSIKKFTEEGLHKITENENWIVTCTTNYAANNHYFGDSHWCTASDRDGEYDGFHYFQNYTDIGEILLQFTSKRPVFTEDESEFITGKYPSKIEKETGKIRYDLKSIQVQTNGSEVLQACDFMDRSINPKDYLDPDMYSLIFNKELVSKFSAIREQQREPENKYQEKYTQQSLKKREKKRAEYNKKYEKLCEQCKLRNEEEITKALEKFNNFFKTGQHNDVEKIRAIDDERCSFIEPLNSFRMKNNRISMFAPRYKAYVVRSISDYSGPYDVRVDRRLRTIPDSRYEKNIAILFGGNEAKKIFEINKNSGIYRTAAWSAGAEKGVYYLMIREPGVDNDIKLLDDEGEVFLSLNSKGAHFELTHSTLYIGFGMTLFNFDTTETYIVDGDSVKRLTDSRMFDGEDNARYLAIKEPRGSWYKFNLYDYHKNNVVNFDLIKDFNMLKSREDKRATEWNTDFSYSSANDLMPMTVSNNGEFLKMGCYGDEYNAVALDNPTQFIFGEFCYMGENTEFLRMNVCENSDGEDICLGYEKSTGKYYIWTAADRGKRIPSDRFGYTEKDRVAAKNLKDFFAKGGYTPEQKAQLEKMWADREQSLNDTEGGDAMSAWNDNDTLRDTSNGEVMKYSKDSKYNTTLQNFDDNNNWRGYVGIRDPEGYQQQVTRAINEPEGINNLLNGDVPYYMRRNPWFRIGRDGRPIDQPWYSEDEIPARLSDDRLQEHVNNLRNFMRRMGLLED